MFEIYADIGQKIFAKFFSFLNLRGLRAGNMQVHWFVGLLASTVFHEAASPSLDLNSAAGFLLDVLDVRTTLSDDLCAKIEAGDVLHVYGDLFLGPFASSEFIPFKRFRLSAPEASFVNQVRKLLFHELFNLFNGFFKASFGGTCDMKVERWVRRSGHALVRIVRPSSSNIGSSLFFDHLLGRTFGQSVTVP